jgi:hypothetical protein
MPKTAKAKIWPLRTLGVKIGVVERVGSQLGVVTLGVRNLTSLGIEKRGGGVVG